MERYKKLSKELAGANEDDNEEAILKLLKRIYKVKDDMTYDILKKTKIGKNVGVNRKREGMISEISTKIVDSWRHLDPNYKRPSSATTSSTAKPSESTKKAKREPETLAQLTTRLFKKYLEPKCDGDIFEAGELAEKFGNEFGEKYSENEKGGRDALTVLIQGLNDKDQEMRNNLMRGVWSIEDIIEQKVDITPTRLKTEKEEEKKMMNDKIFIHEVDMNQETDTLECPKCHGFKARYYEKQTRSADEPMTIFARCVLCGFRWRK